jgi:NAD(P)-dependent dehydrogenase (short-subunit alcohol dehydrogenase family)
MDLGIAGKRALVTGASDGIGEAIAMRLAHEGVIVGVHGRDSARIAKVVNSITGAGGEARALMADLTDPHAADELADAALAALGQIDILVGNAGGDINRKAGPYDWDGVTRDEFVAAFDLNVFSNTTLIQRLAPLMTARGFGRIVLIASASGIAPLARQAAYGASKAAVLNLTVSASKWLRGAGVTINAVSPGLILTKGSKRTIENMAAAKGWGGDFSEIEPLAVRNMGIPVGRAGRVEEVAGLVAFLASTYAGFIHGADLRIDGGVVGTLS